MKFRFIEYKQDIYIVIGIGYDQFQECPEYFLCIPLTKQRLSLFGTVLLSSTTKIPIDQAIEITSKNKLLALLVLYG